MSGSETLRILNQRWKNCCRIVFKREIGDIYPYVPYLQGLIDPVQIEKSAKSGNEVAFAIGNYAKGSRRISFGEQGKEKTEPLAFDDIKDIDSVISALGQRACYSGDIVLGNFSHVEKSSGITDCFYLYGCSLLSDAKHCAFTQKGRVCNDLFGCWGPGETEFCIRCSQTYLDKRCFELWTSQKCSDCYYSYYLKNCTECLFCFNSRNLSHAIGNLKLPKEKYFALKEKLVSEIADELERKKKLPSLMDIAEAGGKPNTPKISVSPRTENSRGQKAVEDDFPKVSSLILGKPLGKISDYKEWLERGTEAIMDLKSAASGGKVLFFPRGIAAAKIPRNRLVTEEEATALGKQPPLSEKEAERLSFSTAPELISRLAFFNVEFWEGTNIDLTECPIAIESARCLRSGVVYSKYVGHTFYTRTCEHIYGCNQVFDCAFCMKCYYSNGLQRCFEVDFSRDCSDCHFSHNIENCHDCMFCFNVKNLKYAIGNVEMGKEEYARVKKMVLAEIASKLEKEKTLPWSIYSIGAQPKK